MSDSSHSRQPNSKQIFLPEDATTNVHNSLLLSQPLTASTPSRYPRRSKRRQALSEMQSKLQSVPFDEKEQQPCQTSPNSALAQKSSQSDAEVLTSCPSKRERDSRTSNPPLSAMQGSVSPLRKKEDVKMRAVVLIPASVHSRTFPQAAKIKNKSPKPVPRRPTTSMLVNLLRAPENQAVLQWFKPPAPAFRFEDLPEPADLRAVSRWSHRFLYYGPSVAQYDKQAIINAFELVLLTAFPKCRPEDFGRVAIESDGKDLYLDLGIERQEYYEPARSLTVRYGEGEFRVSSSGALLRPTETVLRVDGLSSETTTSEVLTWLRAAYGAFYQPSAIWGVYNISSVHGIEFVGQVYVLGDYGDFGPYEGQGFPSYARTSCIKNTARVALYFDGRPEECVDCPRGWLMPHTIDTCSLPAPADAPTCRICTIKGHLGDHCYIFDWQ